MKRKFPLPTYPFTFNPIHLIISYTYRRTHTWFKDLSSPQILVMSQNQLYSSLRHVSHINDTPCPHQYLPPSHLSIHFNPKERYHFLWIQESGFNFIDWSGSKSRNFIIFKKKRKTYSSISFRWSHIIPIRDRLNAVHIQSNISWQSSKCPVLELIEKCFMMTTQKQRKQRMIGVDEK